MFPIVALLVSTLFENYQVDAAWSAGVCPGFGWKMAFVLSGERRRFET